MVLPQRSFVFTKTPLAGGVSTRLLMCDTPPSSGVSTA